METKRLKPNTVAYYKEALLAVEDLERKYKGEKQKSIYGYTSDVFKLRLHKQLDCPLCQLVAEHKPDAILRDGMDCTTYCPWGFIEGIKANRFLCVAAHYDDQTTEERLKRIARWKSWLEKKILR